MTKAKIIATAQQLLVKDVNKTVEFYTDKLGFMEAGSLFLKILTDTVFLVGD